LLLRSRLPSLVTANLPRSALRVMIKHDREPLLLRCLNAQARCQFQLFPSDGRKEATRLTCSCRVRVLCASRRFFVLIARGLPWCGPYWDGCQAPCQCFSGKSTSNCPAAFLILAKASSRSSSDTPIVWSERAIALRIWLAGSSGLGRGKSSRVSSKEEDLVSPSTCCQRNSKHHSAFSG
jgi:hypothetical protein